MILFDKYSYPLVIENNNLGSKLIYNDECQIILNNRPTFYINEIAKMHFIDYYVYKKIVNKQLNIKYKIPFIINNNLIFILIGNIKKDSHVWLNYSEIKKMIFLDNQVVINFNNGFTYNLSIKSQQFNLIINKIDVILNYVNNMKADKFNDKFVKNML